VSGYGDAVDALVWGCAIMLFISVPLAIWKLIDIAIWLYHHIHVTVGATP
jgi:hypothetical protein